MSRKLQKIAHYRCGFILKSNILMNLFFTFFILVYFCVFHSMGVICGIILKTQVRMSGLHY